VKKYQEFKKSQKTKKKQKLWFGMKSNK
jgi:hypothetical protein